MIETSPTFRPLAGNRYKCNQTGAVVSKKMLPSYKSAFLKSGSAAADGLLDKTKVNTEPKKKGKKQHRSTYRSKHS